MTDDQAPPRPVYGRAGSGGRQREDRGRGSRAREAAEALFTPKRAVEPPAPDSPPENHSEHRRRVLPALRASQPAATAQAPAAPQPEAVRKIPAAHFARVRAWVAYGMTVRKAAEIYGVSVEEVRRILRSA